VSDERLRVLERRWKETGSVEDEAAWLRERVRVGDLSENRLEVAAYLGHLAALEARCMSSPDIDFRKDEEDEEGNRKLLLPWATGLLRLSLEAARRAVFAGCSHALRFYEAEFDTILPRTALAAAESLLVSGEEPTQEHSELVTATFNACPDTGYGAPPEHIGRAACAAAAAAHALRLCVSSTTPELDVFEALASADQAIAWSRFDYSRSQPCDWSPGRASPVSSAAVVELIREELVPWALGPHDPVAARVTAEQE
jgi:hypothetical protein